MTYVTREEGVLSSDNYIGKISDEFSFLFVAFDSIVRTISKS